MNASKKIPTIDTLEAFNELMTSLLKEQGIVGRHEEFDTINEGTIPPGIESSSGKVLTEDGRVFTYWLGWDPDKTAPDRTKGWYTLGENRTYEVDGETRTFFHEVLPSNEGYPNPDDSSFLAAKKKLGLA